MKINSDVLFPKVYNEQFKAIQKHEFTEYINSGGRGSVKSSFISLNIILLILQNPEFNALVLRKVSNTLRDSVYTQLKWAADKLGVAHLFNFTLAPLQATYTPTGQTIFFRGADDPLKIKSIKPERGYIAITWFEEWAEFTANDTETIKLSTMRGGNKFYIFYSFNPPSSVRAWVNGEMRTNRQDRFILSTNYTQVPPEWLGEAFLHEAEEMRLHNERSYKNVFLGEPTGTGANVFENIELREITDDEINRFDFMDAGVDFGYYPDAFRLIVFSYDNETKTLYIFYELSLLKHSNFAASEKMRAFCNDNEIPYDIRITADSANPKDIADMREYGWNLRGAVKGRGSLDAGFKWLQSLNKIVVDPSRCPYTADELSLYEYETDKRTGELLEGYPQNQPDHSLAALRYGLEPIWRHKGE